MERLDFSEKTPYNSVEASIHLNRYAFVKPFCEGADILDAACGQGYGSYLMKTWGAKTVTGIDIDQETVDQASRLFQQDGLRYLQHSVEQLPFQDASFDVVVSFETIEHVDAPDAFLKEIKRVLKPGGTVIISCPNDNYYYQNDCAKNPFHKEEYTYFQFKELAEKHLGNEAEYFFSFALDGFVNLPWDKLTTPEDNEKPCALDLVKYEICDSALCVPQERYLNMWNANYYIGIWGRKENLYKLSTVIAPRDYFVSHKDEDFDFLAHVAKLQEELAQLSEKWEKAETDLLRLYQERDAQAEACRHLQEANAQLNQQVEDATAQKEMLQNQCECQQKEYAELTERLEKMTELEARLAAANEKYAQLKQKSDGQLMANARLTELLDLARKEQEKLKEYADDQARAHGQVWEILDSTRNELESMRKECAELQMHMDGQLMANARLTDLLALAKQERSQLQEYAQSLAGQVAYVQGERDWLRGRWESLFFIRVKRLLTRILRKVKRVLGRGN